MQGSLVGDPTVSPNPQATSPKSIMKLTTAKRLLGKTHHFEPNFASVALAKRRDERVYVEYSVPLITPEKYLLSTVDAAAINAVTHP